MKKYGKYEKMPDGTRAKQPPVKNMLLQTYFTSLLCLVLCVSMFFGTSFAWFTSEVTNGGNEIYIGTLDVELSMQVSDGEGTTYVSLSEVDTESGANVTKLYTNAIHWEPGYTALRTLRVENKGDLAFAYTLSFTDGMATGEVSQELLETAAWFDVWVFDHQSNAYVEPAAYTEITTENGWVNVGKLDEVLKGKNVFKGNMNKDDVAGKKDTAHTYTIALHMNGDVEVMDADEQKKFNELMGKSIGLNVKMVATQLGSEQDAFGNTYDVVFTDVSSPDELMAAFEKGGNIRLTNDIVLENVLNVDEGEEIYLDMNGKKITTAGTAADPVFYTNKGSKLTIDGNGTVVLTDPIMSLILPGGDVVIENGTFIREVPEGTPADKVGAMFVGVKVDPWGSQTVTINGGYFDGGYYDANAADIDEILAGTKTFTETADDIAKRGNSADANIVRVALKNNVSKTLNLSYNLFKVYGGTFVGMNPAWGDEGCMLPTTPNYLRPWSYYQGELIEGQKFHENGIVLPEGFSITKGQTEDGRPTYTVNYTK